MNIEVYENYKACLKKKSRKNRKPCAKTNRLGILEYGNSAIAFIFKYSDKLFDELEVWWEMNDTVGEYPCELIPLPELNEIHIVFFEQTRFYRGKDTTLEATSDNPDPYVYKYEEVLPDWVLGDVKNVIVTDWDYGLNEWEIK